MKKIIICGGHPSPAIAVIEVLIQLGGYEIVYVGQKYSPDNRTESWEYAQIQNLKIKFINIKAGKLKRHVDLSSLISLIKIPLGLWESFSILKKEKPDIVVSFGGFIALPIAIWAKLMKVSILTHEQTVKIGLTNKIIAKLANTFCVSWKFSLSTITHKHLVFTGNPLRSEILSPNSSRFTGLKKSKKQILYITGGGLGSHSINLMVSEIITKLLKNYIVIHQTGSAEPYRDYEMLSNIKEKLSMEIKKDYFICRQLRADDVGWILRNAFILIGRSGANTVTEILYCHRPAILIPLPWAGAGEQMENAKMLERLGVVTVLKQFSLNGEGLFEEIIKMSKNIDAYRGNFNSQTDKLIKINSATLIAKEIKILLAK